MMIQNVAAGALLVFALAGCSAFAPNEKLPPQPSAEGVELTKEQGGRFIAFVGPKLQHTEPFLGVSDTNYYCLRSWLDNKTGETAHQLYVADSYYGSPYKWDGVHDKDNKALRFIAISRNEITCDQGCSYADEFAAALPEDYLRAHTGGIDLVFTSSEGKALPVSVPAKLVGEELAAIDAVRGVVARAAAGTSPSPAAPAAAPVPPPQK